MYHLIRPMLVKEIQKARAPFTRCRIATIFETDKGLITAHNIEYSKHNFVHAEASAVEVMKMMGSKKIKTIYMAGYGSFRIKGVSPCLECFLLIKPYLNKHTKLILFEPNTLRKTMAFNRLEFERSYSNQSYSEIKGQNPEQISLELHKKTLLSDTDIKFITSLRLIGLEKGIHFYLTGSKSGRGGIGSLILKKTRGHSDIDLMIVTKREPQLIEKIFSDELNKYYQIIKKRSTCNKFTLLAKHVTK